jgi:hypothetical protein
MNPETSPNIQFEFENPSDNEIFRVKFMNILNLNKMQLKKKYKFKITKYSKTPKRIVFSSQIFILFIYSSDLYKILDQFLKKDKSDFTNFEIHIEENKIMSKMDLSVFEIIKDEQIREKDKLIREKDEQIQEKDEQIRELKNLNYNHQYEIAKLNERIKELTALTSTPLSPFSLTLSPDSSSSMSSPIQATNNEENANEVTIPSPKQDEEITIDSLLSKKKSPVEK